MKSNINECWSAFWANLEVYNSSAAWIKDLEVCSYKLSVMAVNEFSANDITLAVRKISKWKAP